MLRRLVFVVPLSLVALSPKSLLAAADCPDGWFCEDNAAPPPAPPRPPAPPAPPGDWTGPEEPGLAPPPGAPPGYPTPAASAHDESSIDLEVPDNAPPVRRRHRRGFHEWGFNLHLEVALMGDQRHRASDAGMAGLGFGFRYRPIPELAFEAGVDLLTGTDYQGYSRSEAALLVNTLVFFNPHDVVQFYGLGGLGVSGATVTIAPASWQTPFQRHDEHYTYFGGQLGIGLEVRVTRSVAIASDLIGFVRGRADDLADSAPEFTDPDTHRVTNVSGGGLLRAGATFYW